jgi:hypothetical protein
MEFLQTLAMIGAVVLPFWNIPLILRIIERKSSQDISLPWAFGVWGCLLLMFPSTFFTPDPVFRVFNFFNFILFTGVLAVILIYRRK